MTEEAFSISSKALPEFEDLTKEWDEKIGKIREAQEPKKKKKVGSVIQDPILNSSDDSVIKLEASQIEDWVCFIPNAIFLRSGKRELSNLERKSFSKATADLLNKYMPTAAKWGEEIAFLTCVSMIIATRAEAPKPKKKTEPIKPEPQKAETNKTKVNAEDSKK